MGTACSIADRVSSVPVSALSGIWDPSPLPVLSVFPVGSLLSVRSVVSVLSVLPVSPAPSGAAPLSVPSALPVSPAPSGPAPFSVPSALPVSSVPPCSVPFSVPSVLPILSVPTVLSVLSVFPVSSASSDVVSFVLSDRVPSSYRVSVASTSNADTRNRSGRFGTNNAAVSSTAISRFFFIKLSFVK